MFTQKGLFVIMLHLLFLQLEMIILILFPCVDIVILAWCQTGSKPLSEPIMAHFTDAYMYYSP